jgi:hypothetical protein
VGAGGGAGASSNSFTSISGTTGSNSIFSTITSIGGGGGGAIDGQEPTSSFPTGKTGGSGGGGHATGFDGVGTNKGLGTANQGYDGGNGFSSTTDGANQSSGGGGGAGQAGSNGSSSVAGVGGNGVSSSITGSAVTRAGGGGGTRRFGSAASGGTGGGGAGAINATATSGTVNTGGGGGASTTGESSSSSSGGSGGSGIVILTYPSAYDIRNGAGLTYTTSVVGGNKVTVFTAGTGNIQFADAVNSSFVLLETVTLTSAQASVEFTDLNTKYGSTYQHLQIRISARCGAAANLKIQYNGDTAGNYSFHYLEGTGSSVISGAGTSQSSGDLGVAVAETNVFSGFVVDLLDPFETTKFKTGRSFYGAATAGSKWLGIMSHNWRSTSAVTSIKLAAGAQSYQTGSRISIYGLKGS